MEEKEEIMQEVAEETVVTEVADDQEEEMMTEKEFLGSKKPKGEKNENSMFSRVVNIFLWIVLIAFMAIWLIDFFKVQNEKEPMFCIKKSEISYSDGSTPTKVCTGLGYKVYNFDRKGQKGVQFSPFWAKDPTEK